MTSTRRLGVAVVAVVVAVVVVVVVVVVVDVGEKDEIVFVVEVVDESLTPSRTVALAWRTVVVVVDVELQTEVAEREVVWAEHRMTDLTPIVLT